MARTQEFDFIQNFRFHVRALGTDGTGGKNFLELDRGNDLSPDGEAGFQSATIPEMTLDATEYREGIYKWTRKYPGIPTFGDISLMRGVIKQDTLFFDWAMAVADGSEYRDDVDIYQYSRQDLAAFAGVEEHISATPSRIYHCKGCFPIRAKPAADLDATSGEVAIAELDLSCEYYELEKL